MLTAKRKLLLHLKNIPGWTTKKKLVVLSVDDYGNIRMASKQAREVLKQRGLPVDGNRFDLFDALEDAADLEQLYDTLSSVKDKNGNAAVFTAFSLPANIDFHAMKESGYASYRYQRLPETFASLPGYEGTWSLWNQGIREKLLHPEFHGREHLNVKLLMELLGRKEPDVMLCFEHNSYAAIRHHIYKTIGFPGAFQFDQFSEHVALAEIAADGLNVFEDVFGSRATHFNAPGAREHHSLERVLAEGGIRYMDTDPIKIEHQGGGRYSRKLHYLGQRNRYDQVYLIRNCVFEPLLDPATDWVQYCMEQIGIAFRWNKPANISSHRVNFCGHIEPRVREKGLAELKRLLKAIVTRWPDVEFVNSRQLGEMIRKDVL